MIFIRHKNMRYNLENVKVYEDAGDAVRFFIKKDIVSPQTAPLTIPKNDPVEILVFEDVARDLERLFGVKRKKPSFLKEKPVGLKDEIGDVKTGKPESEGPKVSPAAQGQAEPQTTARPGNPFATDPEDKPPAPAVPQRSGVSKSPESVKAEKEAKSKTDNPQF